MDPVRPHKEAKLTICNRLKRGLTGWTPLDLRKTTKRSSGTRKEV